MPQHSLVIAEHSLVFPRILVWRDDLRWYTTRGMPWRATRSGLWPCARSPIRHGQMSDWQKYRRSGALECAFSVTNRDFLPKQSRGSVIEDTRAPAKIPMSMISRSYMIASLLFSAMFWAQAIGCVPHPLESGAWAQPPACQIWGNRDCLTKNLGKIYT